MSSFCGTCADPANAGKGIRLSDVHRLFEMQPDDPNLYMLHCDGLYNVYIKASEIEQFLIDLKRVLDGPNGTVRLYNGDKLMWQLRREGDKEWQIQGDKPETGPYQAKIINGLYKEQYDILLRTYRERYETEAARVAFHSPPQPQQQLSVENAPPPPYSP